MKLDKDTRWHFRTQLALLLLVTGIIVASITDIWFEHFETDYLLSSHHKKNQQMAMVLSRSAVIPILEKNNEELEHLVKAMFQVDPSLRYLQIADTQGNTIIQSGSELALSTLNKDYIQKLEIPVKNNQQSLANIHITWDKTSINDDVVHHVRSAIWGISMTMLLLSFLLFIGLKYLVINPIEKINTKLRAIADNEQTEDLLQNSFVSKEINYLSDRSNHLDSLYKEQVATKRSLAIAKSKAEAANVTKNEFLSIVSHELRTPINGVLGLLEVLMKDKNLTYEQINNVSVAHSAADSLFMTVSNILDFSQTDEGKIQLKSIELNLSNLANEAVEMANKGASQKPINLQCVNDPNIPSRLHGDPVRIRQILNNLLSNAVKFTDQGSITVHTKLVSKKDETAEIQIAVCDSGMGISDEKKAALFQPFYQADTSASREHGGVGLGLAINHHLVAAMGGEITVESELGKGSTFTVTLPLKIVKADNTKAKVTSQALPPLSGTILLAEDNPINKLVATKILHSFGLKVEHAANGAIAFELFKKKPFDVVLMDIQMPEMDGFESSTCIRHWENEQQSARTPIIALTANVLEADKEKCFDVGMDDFLTKPIDTQVLHETLRRRLEKTTATNT